MRKLFLMILLLISPIVIFAYYNAIDIVLRVAILKNAPTDMDYLYANAFVPNVLFLIVTFLSLMYIFIRKLRHKPIFFNIHV